jgi:hypothetical protein
VVLTDGMAAAIRATHLAIVVSGDTLIHSTA